MNKRNQKKQKVQAGSGLQTELPLGVRLLRTLDVPEIVRSLAFDPHGEILASGNADGSVKLWEMRTGRLLRILKGNQGVVFSLAFDSRGQMLAIAGYDRTVKLWKADTGKLQWTLEGHQAAVWSLAFNPYNGTLATGSAPAELEGKKVDYPVRIVYSFELH